MRHAGEGVKNYFRYRVTFFLLTPSPGSCPYGAPNKEPHMSIRTEYDPKPGPTTRFDWSAVTTDYKPGDPIGYASTKEEDHRGYLLWQIDEQGGLSDA